jgi:hypothetical protein
MSVLNHKEALELAHYQKEHSNLSRCYIDLREKLTEKEAETTKARFENQIKYGSSRPEMYKTEYEEQLEQQLAELTNKLEFTEAIVAADGALITGLKNDAVEREKQNVLLRGAVEKCLDDGVSKTAAPHSLSLSTIDACEQALEATADLAGLVVCDAEPVAWHYEGSDIELPSVALSDDLDDEQKQNCTELFARRKEKS